MVNMRLFKELREAAASTVSLKKKTRFRLISEFLEFHKTSSTKMKHGQPKYKLWQTGCKMDLVPSPSKKT